MTRRHRVPRLSAREWLLVAESTLALILHGIRLRLAAPERWLPGPQPAPAATDLATARAVAHAVRRGARLTGARCLAQALAARTMLARRGLEGEVAIGAAGGGGGNRFHAWCTHAGLFVTGAHPDRFRPFAPTGPAALPDP